MLITPSKRKLCSAQIFSSVLHNPGDLFKNPYLIMTFSCLKGELAYNDLWTWPLPIAFLQLQLQHLPHSRTLQFREQVKSCFNLYVFQQARPLPEEPHFKPAAEFISAVSHGAPWFLPFWSPRAPCGFLYQSN